MKKMRADLFICFILATLLFYGLGVTAEKTGLNDKVWDYVDQNLEEGQTDVPDGEVGGFATDETPRAESIEDMMYLAKMEQNFTVEVQATAYQSYGYISGKSYEWRLLKLKDDMVIAVRLNKSKIQQGSGMNPDVLPVGKLVVEKPEILQEMREKFSEDSRQDITLVSDAYIDMDGEANATAITLSMGDLVVIEVLFSFVFPLLLFAVYMGTIFGIHAIFVKIGLFPPVFSKK